MTGHIKPRAIWPLPATATDLVPAWVGEFSDFNDWVVFAPSCLSRTYDPMTGAEVQAICIDAVGRRCSMGAHFMRAHKEGTFPVRFFWDFAPRVAPEARATGEASGHPTEPNLLDTPAPAQPEAMPASKLPETHDGLRVLASYDDGTLVCLSGYSGGRHPDGAWSVLHLAFYGADGTLDKTTAYRALKAQPEAAEMPGREEVARIIDPESWGYIDRFGHELGAAYPGAKAEPSLTKADAILALLSPSAKEPGRG